MSTQWLTALMNINGDFADVSAIEKREAVFCSGQQECWCKTPCLCIYTLGRLLSHRRLLRQKHSSFVTSNSIGVLHLPSHRSLVPMRDRNLFFYRFCFYRAERMTFSPDCTYYPVVEEAAGLQEFGWSSFTFGAMVGCIQWWRRESVEWTLSVLSRERLGKFPSALSLKRRKYESQITWSLCGGCNRCRPTDAKCGRFIISPIY